MPVDKVSIQQFSQAIKEKYPEYKDVNDTLLTQRILEKYPQYQRMVDFSPPKPSTVDQGGKETSDKVNEGLQFNGTFQPDLEGEKKGLYLNDPDYQKQKQDFVGKIMTDERGRLLYPEQDKAGNWFNYYTKEQMPGFDPKSMSGKILQVPHDYLPATNGKQFITPKMDQRTGEIKFPGVETPSAPHIEELPQATIYGKQKNGKETSAIEGVSPEVQSIIDESNAQGGQFKNVLQKNPQLAQDIDKTLSKYGDEYKQSFKRGSGAMSNVLQKTIEDKYRLNDQLPTNIDANVLNGHLNVLNNFDQTRKQFEGNQKELQHQADLIVDHSKRTGEPVDQNALDALVRKQQSNIDKWNTYSKAVNFAQNYVNQPEVKDYLSKVKQKQEGLQLLDEVRQRAFPKDTNIQIKQDEYDRKALEGNLNVLDYLKTATGRAASGLSNIGETAANVLPSVLTGGFLRPSQDYLNMTAKWNENAQAVIEQHLPEISKETLEQMDKRGIGHLVNDISSMVGGFAPYILPGLAEEGATSKGLTFATALAQSLPEVKKEAEKIGLTGSAYNTYLTLKPLITSAFMSLLPSAKFAKGFENDVAKSIVNGEFNSPKRMLLNLATKAFTKPEDIAHMQAMLSGTEIGNALTNDLTNHLQAGEDVRNGITRNGDIPVDLSNIINPRQTAVMALAGKILESVPTMHNAISDMRNTDLAKAYDNAQNNLVELAASNLEGVSKKIDQILKKNPGDIYATHIKNTIQDFAKAEATMPEGLQPEQKAAIFDIQQKVKKLKEQQANAGDEYKEHFDKNIEDLNKQIPAILKDRNAANKYLGQAHTEFVSQIQSPKTDENGKETEANAQAEGQQVLNKQEGAAEGTTETAPSNITPDQNYRTLNYGDENKGQQETKEAQEKIKQQILNDEPIGGNGDRFSGFLKRVIPNFKNILDKEPHNTVLVTHSSVIKALRVWEEMGRPDIDKLSTDQIKEFAQKYVDLKPEAEGKVNTFKGDNGNDIKVVRHGETEDNKLSEFRTDDTQLTDKGVEQAKKAADNLVNETGGNIPKVLSSDLPRTLHTSDIIQQKIKDHAVSIGQPEAVGAHADGDGGAGGTGESGGVGSGQQGEGPAGESPEKEKGASEKEGIGPPTGHEADWPFAESPKVGISHESQRERAFDLKADEPQRGEGVTLEQAVQRGRDLIKEGADPEQVAQDFKKDGKISWDAVSIARAKYEQLAKATNVAHDKFGEDSEEYKSAKKEEIDWLRNTVKPMQTEWSKIGMTQQGATDIDTGTVSGMKRAIEDKTGQPVTPEQAKTAKDLSDKVKEHEAKIKDLEGKLDKLHKQTEGQTQSVREKAKDLAKRLRDNAKLNKPGMFSAATPASIVWDSAVEVVAKAIEAGGELAQAIQKGIEHIKDSDWYKGLSANDQKEAEKQFVQWHNQQNAEGIKSDENKEKLASTFTNKKDNKFTPEEAKSIWEYTKETYLNNKTDIDEAIRNVATDLGLTADQVIHAIATPKGAREVTNAMWVNQYERRKAINSATNYVANLDKKGVMPALQKVNRFFFNLKTFGHGTVGNITHAGSNIFRPSTWSAYWPNVMKSFSLAYGSTGNYEKNLSILKSQPHFNEWLQAGLAADPNKIYDEYQMLGKAKTGTWQWVKETGTRGFAGLNFMRYDMAEKLYKRASESAKADPEFREMIAELVNHATGHSEVRVPQAIKLVTFAPGLEISRWQRMITDPGKAAGTFLKWNKATDAEKAAAKVVAGGMGERIAVWGSLLAANAGLLSAMGSKQKINVTDPTQSDFMKFKFNDMTLDVSGNILSPIRLLSVIGGQAYLANVGDRKDVKKKPGDKDSDTITKQARYKLSPAAGTVTDLATGTDALGNTLPWSDVKPAKGKHQLTWKEVFASETLPIPIQAGLQSYYESMEKNGMPENQINAILKAAIIFGLEGFTGAKYQDDYSLSPPTQKGHSQRQR